MFIIAHILSSLEPFGTPSDNEAERALISLTSCLMVSAVHISDTEKVIGVGVEAEKGNERRAAWLPVHGCHKYLRDRA